MIRLEEGDCGTYLVVNVETGADVLVQTDYDFPGLASTFGWSPCSGCPEKCKGATDGTISCLAKSASEMILEATEYLDEAIGEEVEDPGYF